MEICQIILGLQGFSICTSLVLTYALPGYGLPLPLLSLVALTWITVPTATTEGIPDTRSQPTERVS